MGHTLIPASCCIRHLNFAQRSLSSRQYWYAETVTALLYPSLPQGQIYPLEQISSPNLLGEGTQTCWGQLTAPRCLSQDSKEKAALGPVISPAPCPSAPGGLRASGSQVVFPMHIHYKVVKKTGQHFAHSGKITPGPG